MITMLGRVFASIAFPALFGFYVGATVTLMCVVHGTLNLTNGLLTLMVLGLLSQSFAMYREMRAMRDCIEHLATHPVMAGGRRSTDRPGGTA